MLTNARIFLNEIRKIEQMNFHMKGKCVVNRAIFLDRDGTINIEKDYLFKIEDFECLNKWMLNTLEENKVHIDKVYFCPHRPDAKIPEYRANCECRKPRLGLYRQAIEAFGLNLAECYAIGDKIRDYSICEIQ